MIIIASKKISKSADKVIQAVEKELKEVDEIYVDKTINSRIEREISHLGKEKLIVDHVNNLAKKFNKRNKNKILFLLVKLYNFNKQIHESLLKELKNDKKLLNRRIKLKFDKTKVQKELYKKLLKIADAHFKVVKGYAKSFNPKKKYSPRLLLNVVQHKRKAEKIYKALANVKMRTTLHKVLLKKLDQVYQILIDFTVELANSISLLVKEIRNNKVGKVRKDSKDIQSIVSDKIGLLKSFAYKFTYNIIHEEKFYDFDNKKLVLITKKA